MSYHIKKFTPFDKSIKLVSKPSDLDPYDNDPDVLRAVLSCGHITGPETLTACCDAQINDGQTEFRCPLCMEEWPYDEVRKLAKLTLEEQKELEGKLGINSAEKIVDFRDCPECGTLLERSDVSSLCVACAVCTAKTGRVFEFCWQCLREWKGPRPRSDHCENEGCRNDEDMLLTDCPMITLTYFLYSKLQCPKIRKCPACGSLIEHDRTGCNSMKCPECHHEFCFICLQLGHKYESSPCTLAPRQKK